IVAPDGSLPLGIFMDDRRYVNPWSGRARWTVDRRGFAEAEIEDDAAFEADFAHMLAVRGFTDLPAPGHRDGDAIRRDGRSTTIRRDGTRVRLEFAPVHPAPEPPDLPQADGVLGRAYEDLRMLWSSHDGLQYFAAGVPWFCTLFGRDSLITAYQVLAIAPDIAADTLRLHARLLGRAHDPPHEEEPGKVLHEFRFGDTDDLAHTRLARYYGTVDATPLWLCLLAAHPDARVLAEELQDAVEATLEHIGDGLLTYEA